METKKPIKVEFLIAQILNKLHLNQMVPKDQDLEIYKEQPI